MLRIHPIANAENAKAYYTTSDYFLDTPGEWIGKGAELLGLSGRCDRKDFDALCDNVNPTTGMPLTVVTRDGRRTGWDLNFNAVKSCGIAREILADIRVEDAHREAVKYAIGEVEKDMATRVRVGGQDDDRVTGNLVGMHVVHRTTRPNQDDHLPDMALHSHVVVFNATRDPVENRWKAAQIGGIKHDAPYYEALYHNRLAANLKAIGYGIRRKGKAFEIEGISDEMIRRFSRRTATIEEMAAVLGVKNAASKAKLGATTRLHKVELKEDDLTRYWRSRLSDEERAGMEKLIGQPSYQSDERQAVGWAISHMFERNSVVDERRLYEAAIRHGIGCVSPEAVRAEAVVQGVLSNGKEATTRDLLAEERRIIAFARDGRGSCKPMATEEQLARQKDFQRLSGEQKRIVMHIGLSKNRVIVVEGDAGTGKTDALKVSIPGIKLPGVMLAPSAEASRGVLRSKGFANADTLQRFLLDTNFQEEARDGFILLDEAPLAGFKDIDRLMGIAKELNARVILQGDRKQHHSVQRGNLFPVLERFAGLPTGRLKEIWRQQNDGYKQAVASLAKGDMTGGFDRLAALGWVKETASNAPLVDDYMAALDAKKSVIVVAPTHVECDEITAELRHRLKETGIVATDERVFEQLKPLSWTEAERGDLGRYEGREVMRFHYNSGSFRAGQRVRVADWKPGQKFGKPADFSVYEPASIAIAAGDKIRATAGGKTKDGKHKFDNGYCCEVAGFTESGDIRLKNGWVIAKEFSLLTHNYVTTSHASQGRTVDRVLVSMGSESVPAINAQQAYVSLSRGRESARVYSNLPADELRQLIQRSDSRKAATELMAQPMQKRPDRLRRFSKRIRDSFRQLRDKAMRAANGVSIERERDYAGQQR
jgi:conjugative relaxase-like TrwC/TraI family protein